MVISLMEIPITVMVPVVVRPELLMGCMIAATMPTRNPWPTPTELVACDIATRRQATAGPCAWFDAGDMATHDVQWPVRIPLDLAQAETCDRVFQVTSARAKRRSSMQPLKPIDVRPLFPGERTALLDLLGDLSVGEWAASTICPGWSVKEVALHLLGDDIGRLSGGRDSFPNPSFAARVEDLAQWDGLLAAIDRQNATWVAATRRISPPLLIELLRFTGELTEAYFGQFDIEAIGRAVDWAGPEPAPIWLDVAREYTERWVHQQQIRDAVGRPGLKERRWFGPVLETFVHGLRRALRDAIAPSGTVVRLIVTGDAGGEWIALRSEEMWWLGSDPPLAAAATVEIDQEIAWRLFTRGISKEEARWQATINGDAALADRVLDTVSIIA